MVPIPVASKRHKNVYWQQGFTLYVGREQQV